MSVDGCTLRDVVLQNRLNIQTAAAQLLIQHTNAQTVPCIFLAPFTTPFIDLSQVPNISNETGAGGYER